MEFSIQAHVGLYALYSLHVPSLQVLRKCVVLAATPQQQPGHGMAEILGWWPHDLTWCMENTMETLEDRGVQF